MIVVIWSISYYEVLLFYVTRLHKWRRIDSFLTGRADVCICVTEHDRYTERLCLDWSFCESRSHPRPHQIKERRS